jgi:hypothetical protein
VVELTDALQGGFEFAVVAQPLLDHRFPFRTEADLLGVTTGIGDGQHGDQMTLAVGADSAAGAMADTALKQGAAEDVGGGWEGDELPGSQPSWMKTRRSRRS